MTEKPAWLLKFARKDSDVRRGVVIGKTKTFAGEISLPRGRLVMREVLDGWMREVLDY